MSDLDRDEVEELMGALLELRGQLRKLQWFGEVNRKGFIKITKKLDKKVRNTCTQQRYIATKVDPRPFATNETLQKSMKQINSWLSALGESKVQDDATSLHSVHSLKRVSSGSMLNLPKGLLDTVDQALRSDDVSILKETLLEANVEFEDPGMQKLQVNLLQRSISCKAKACIDYLLGQIKSLKETDDINQRNCIHRLVISIGRAKSASIEAEEATNAVLLSTAHSTQYIIPATHPLPHPPASHTKEARPLGLDDESVQILSYLLDKIRPHQRDAIVEKDTFGRMPLHYGAQFGFVVICKLLISHMQEWGLFNVEHGIDAPEWQDSEGLAPLHLSVIGGHHLTTKTLLEAENWQGANDEKVAMRKNVCQSSAILALATKSNFIPIVQLLVDAGVDINWQDAQGEAALHVAARFGNDHCAKILLAGTTDQKADVELVEKSFSWTPLHIAAVDGHLAVVQLLISAGADINRPDASGWAAREHAALRGHMDIAERLAEATALLEGFGSDSEESNSTAASSPPTVSSLEERRSHATDVRPVEPVKTFGHRYLTKESLVLVSLGSMDMRKNVEAVTLDKIPMAAAHSTQLDTALSVVVSAMGASGEPTIIDLPVQDNISTEPIAFTTLDAAKVKLLFDIVPTYSGSHEQKVGRGVALLSSVKPTIGLKRMNLQGDLSVPIVAADTLEVIGTVNFNFLVITPFSHPNMQVTESQTYWKTLSSTMVIGHRGLGKNVSSTKSLQLGENTIQSFIAAANLGANYVEFDVQLTKDHVPVIYHDFLVSETGIDAPVHTLTLEQFLHVNKNTSRSSRAPSPAETPMETLADKIRKVDGSNRPRSMSMGVAIPDSDMDERMKHTRDFKAKGFKGNSRGKFIQAPFTTLEEMFKTLPENVGFNIEMKYPMLFESEAEEMDTYAVELNSFCDTVLTKVYDLGKKRNIIFSSFNPDICLLLSFKQPSIPILFLTDAGTSEVGDIRASSLQEAIRFASRWNLLGVVSAAEPLCNSPRLVKVVKESGLVCVSYGVLNNDPVKVQVSYSASRNNTSSNYHAIN